MLVEQYRMNQNIMQWSSSAMYHNKLVAHQNVKDRLLLDLLNKNIQN
jgi:superfamily I DNA and/or RNA helicase